jgi:hypothetical protein
VRGATIIWCILYFQAKSKFKGPAKKIKGEIKEKGLGFPCPG